MLIAYLAGSGGRVLVPDAIAVIAGVTDAEVQFVDEKGGCLVVFRREDIALYSRDGAFLHEQLSAEPRAEAS